MVETAGRRVNAETSGRAVWAGALAGARWMRYAGGMRTWMLLGLVWGLGVGTARTAEAGAPEAAGRKVVILPIRADISSPMVYLVRRAVKSALESQADLLLVDMETNGGAAGSTLEIMESINRFKGQTVTYVNRNAYSAGAFIAAATQKIYMAPESVIGAAAPIMLSPGGTGVQDIPNTLEAKTTSALSAKVRTYAQKHGHNSDVFEAMIDKQKELEIDGKVLNRKGQILTLTNKEAEREYGNPPKALISAGTVESLEALLAKLGFGQAAVTRIKPSGAEKLATWINALDWLWLILGVGGLYLEFKTPGVILPGIVGVCAFALYFLGSYVAGLAGWEWPALFLVGLLLVGLELFVFPGTVVLGLAGAGLMLVTVTRAMVDIYPGMPAIPTLPQLRVPLRQLTYAALGSIALIFVLSRWLPKTPVYGVLVTQAASGVTSVEAEADHQAARLGREGVALSALRPGGKARFGDELLDVMTQGEMIPKGARIRIIAYSGRDAIVEVVAE
jgi:membrane-bound serine protease (ClpP class)